MDTIAYTCHDLEDAIKSGIVYKTFNLNKDFHERLQEIENEIEKQTGTIKMIKEPYADTFFIRELIHYFIEDLTNHTYHNICTYNIHSIDDVKKNAKNRIVCLSEDHEKLFSDLKTFMYENIYNSQTISLMDEKAIIVVKELFETFCNNPNLLPPDILYKYLHIDSSSDDSGIINDVVRVVCDYISCMTDRSALDEHEKLFNPRLKL